MPLALSPLKRWAVIWSIDVLFNKAQFVTCRESSKNDFICIFFIFPGAAAVNEDANRQQQEDERIKQDEIEYDENEQLKRVKFPTKVVLQGFRYRKSTITND